MKANELSVGGTHYKTTYEHWDLVADLRLGYFEGNVTKYVTRHRSKKGREDLEKALHYGIKALELFRCGKVVPTHSMGWISSEQRTRYEEANLVHTMELNIIGLAVSWHGESAWIQMLALLQHLLDTAYPVPVPILNSACVHAGDPVGGLTRCAECPVDADAAPGASYVNQDQGHG